LGPLLASQPESLAKLIEVLEKLPPKNENEQRKKVLKSLLRKPKEPLDNNQCRSLGDAVFALLCPSSSVISTTNVKDHLPLAQALNKEVVDPTNKVAPPSQT